MKRWLVGLVAGLPLLAGAADYQSTLLVQTGKLTERDAETAAFTSFLQGRMVGSAAEIDDHTNRGRDMDTRTPASQCRFVS